MTHTEFIVLACLITGVIAAVVFLPILGVAVWFGITQGE